MTQTYDEWFEAVAAPLCAAINQEKAIVLSLLHTPQAALKCLETSFRADMGLPSSGDAGWYLCASFDLAAVRAKYENRRELACSLLEDIIDAQELLDEGHPEDETLQRIISERTARVEKLFS